MEATIRTSQERIEAYHKRTERCQLEIYAEIRASEEELKANKETMEAAITSFRSELEQTIRTRVEDFLLSGDQRTKGLARSIPRRSNKCSWAYGRLQRRPGASVRRWQITRYVHEEMAGT
jgi:hypothetical protein